MYVYICCESILCQEITVYCVWHTKVSHFNIHTYIFLPQLLPAENISIKKKENFLLLSFRWGRKNVTNDWKLIAHRIEEEENLVVVQSIAEYIVKIYKYILSKIYRVKEEEESEKKYS